MNTKGREYCWERAYGTLDSHQESPLIRNGVCGMGSSKQTSTRANITWRDQNGKKE